MSAFTSADHLLANALKTVGNACHVVGTQVELVTNGTPDQRLAHVADVERNALSLLTACATVKNMARFREAQPSEYSGELPSV